ncbi:hypothetical protein P4S70_04995 [Enterovibrio sp. Hal110]
MSMTSKLSKGLVKVVSSVSSRSVPGVLNLASLWFFSQYLDNGDYADNSNFVYLVSYISGMTLGVVYFSLVVILPSAQDKDLSSETLACIFRKTFLFLSVLFIFIWLLGLLEPMVMIGILVLSLFQYSVELNRARSNFKKALRLLYVQSTMLSVVVLILWYFEIVVNYGVCFVFSYFFAILLADFSSVVSLLKARVTGDKKIVFDMLSVFSGAFLLKVSEGFVPAFLRYVVLPHYPDSKDFATLAMDLVQRFVATLFNAVKFFVMPSQVKKYHGKKFDPNVGSAQNNISLILVLVFIVGIGLGLLYSNSASSWQWLKDIFSQFETIKEIVLFSVIVIWQGANFYRKNSVDIYLMSNRRYTELVLFQFFALVTASLFFYHGFAYFGVFVVVSVYYVTIYFISRYWLKSQSKLSER